MDFWLYILISALVVALVNLAVRRLAVRMAKRELTLFGARICDDVIEVYADAKSLEYYTRCALMAADENRISVIVYVPRAHIEKDEMLDTIAKLRRRHKNLTYRLI